MTPLWDCVLDQSVYWPLISVPQRIHHWKMGQKLNRNVSTSTTIITSLKIIFHVCDGTALFTARPRCMCKWWYFNHSGRGWKTSLNMSLWARRQIDIWLETANPNCYKCLRAKPDSAVLSIDCESIVFYSWPNISLKLYISRSPSVSSKSIQAEDSNRKMKQNLMHVRLTTQITQTKPSDFVQQCFPIDIIAEWKSFDVHIAYM